MSRVNKSNGKNVTHSTGKKVVPSCPHCRNLGLKNDHWLRESASPDSAVVCPVLLKTECRYCHQLGHNISKCQRLADSKKEKQEKQEKQKAITASTTIHVELDKPSYASIAKQLLNVLHKKSEVEKPPTPRVWVYHGRMDWVENCDSSDDEN